ncbi:hypothetical protein AhyVDH1_035 [Aeromonas phage AhyVDH1]|nr:hypothetical protein AhyVDH1_035 [Aeromonas phage AhyVDH1]
MTEQVSPDVVLTGLPLTGNRCDHDPKNPRLDLDCRPARKGSLPAALKKCIENLRAYYYDRSILRPLAELDASDKKVTAGKRSNRSEAREAEVLVISAIIECLDLTSMLVGVPKDGKFIHRSTYELAKMAGLLDPETDEPHRRFTRCLSRLRRSGFMETTQARRTCKDGTIKAAVGIKCVDPDFIVMLMGGTPKAAAQLEKARASHYKATKERRARGSAPTTKEHRDALAERLIAKAALAAEQEKAQKAARKAAKEGVPPPQTNAMMSPETHKQAYHRARQEFQNELLASGATFVQINTQMRAFPTLENWAP